MHVLIETVWRLHCTFSDSSFLFGCLADETTNAGHTECQVKDFQHEHTETQIYPALKHSMDQDGSIQRRKGSP
eukprot:7559571-Karenia_brevis.AAC.1